MVPDDEVLFARYRGDGDCEALGELFRRRAPELLRIAVFLAPRPTDAEDLVQATFLSAITHADRFHGGACVMNWLCGILANHARSLHRAHARSPGALARRDDVVDAADEALRRELRTALEQAMAGLPQPYRSVAQLHLQSGLDSVAIGARLRCAPATARKRLERALDHLRRVLPLGLATAVVARCSPAQIAERAAGAARAAAATAAFVDAGLVAAPARRALAPLLLSLAGAVALVLLAAWSLSPAPLAVITAAAAAGRAPAEAAGARGAGGERAALGPMGDAVADATATATATLRVRARWLDGTAAADVQLQLVPRPLPALPLSTAVVLGAPAVRRTDADGIAVFDAAPGPHDLGPAGGLCICTVTTPSAREVAVVLDARTAIDGVVVDEDGVPVAAAAIRASETGGRGDPGFEAARTDDRGRFAAVVPFHHGRVWAQAEGHRLSPTLRAAGCRDAQLVCARGGRDLSVRVEDERGVACAGAHVAVVAHGARLDAIAVQHARTDADGRASFAGLGDEPAHVVARATDRAAVAVAVEPGARAVNVVLPASGSVQGRTVGEDGGIAGLLIARVAADEEPSLGPLLSLTAVTGADGGFRLGPLPAGALVLRALTRPATNAFGVRSFPLTVGSMEITVPAGATADCTLAVAAPLVQRGRIVDPAGRPLAGWLLAAVPDDTDDLVLRGGRARYGVSDADGRFSVDGVDRLSPPLLLAYAPGQTDAQGMLPVAVRRLEAGEREPVITADPRAADALTLRGAVVDGSGAALPGARVGWVPEGLLWPRQCGCRGDGSFALAGLAAGAGTLVVEHPEYGKVLREMTLAPGAVAVDAAPVALQPPASLRVQLRRADGAPAAGCASLEQRGRVVARAVAMADGSARFAAVQPGRYLLRAHGERLSPMARDVELQAGRAAACELTAEAAVPVGVEITFAAADNPLALTGALQVELRSGSGEVVLRDAWSAAPGEHRFVGAFELPPGDYRLAVASIWGGTAHVGFAVARAPVRMPVRIAEPLRLPR